jgi:putative component of toxin-antitoxin plasmid stabilization module
MFAVRAAEKKVIGISEVDLHHGSGWRIAGKETYDRLIAEGCKPEDLRGFAKT